MKKFSEMRELFLLNEGSISPSLQLFEIKRALANIAEEHLKLNGAQFQPDISYYCT